MTCTASSRIARRCLGALRLDRDRREGGAVVRSGRTADLGVEPITDRPAVARMGVTLFGGRHVPCVVLTEHLECCEPVLPLREVRAIVGADALIYLVDGEVLPELRRTLGRRLAVDRGMARIFWPELSLRSDPLDHPLVPVLDVEPTESALAEFARQFDLSRPHIRHEIRLLDELRGELEYKNTRLKRDLSEKKHELLQVDGERRAAIIRAETAEQQLRAERDRPSPH